MDIDSEEFLNEELDSDNSEDEDARLELEVTNLENQIAENKFAYQPYVDLINTLKSLVDLDRLRNARKRMAAQFPLSPELWIDWIQDEINIASSVEEKDKIIELFQTSVKDYFSVEIWLQYTAFNILLLKEKNSGDPNLVRSVFEAAITAVGLHVMKSFVVWDSYIDYEKSLLKTFMDSKEDQKNQLKRIAILYKRQLSCPLWNIDDTFENFQNWIKDNTTEAETLIDMKVVENIYKKSKDKLEKIKPFEEALSLDSVNSLEVYNKYLEHEKSKEGSPVRVQSLYERILCENCLNEEIWLDYIDYVDTVLINSDIVLDVCRRAVRNCPWCCKIYQIFVLCLEKYEMPQKYITEVVEEAFGSGLQTASDFRDVWMSYLEYLRRRYDSDSISKEEEAKRLEDLRAAFAKAVEFVLQMQDADPEFSIVQFWARIEAIYCRNMEKARELWNIILTDEKSKTAEMWLEYIHLERTFGDSKHLRKLFPRALQGTKDFPEHIGKVWLNYERDEGTLDSFVNCVKKIKMRINQVEELRQKIKISEVENSYFQVNKKVKRNRISEKKFKEKDSSNSIVTKPNTKNITGYKRKVDFDNGDSPLKKTKHITEEKFENNEEFVKNLLEEEKQSHGETVIHDSSKDNRTVFVSNLDFSTVESVIQEVFSPCGHITDLRLVKDYKGRSKGYCYVEFEKMEEAADALKKDREPINGRPMFVSKCDPDKETRESGFKYSSEIEKNKLFVRGLSFNTTVEDLQRFFSEFGKLKDVRLVTYRNGHSKGLAYVDFENEASAAQAIIKADGATLLDKQISVAISNPPGRKVGVLTSKLSLGGGPKEIGSRGRGRTQISFLPRSLVINKAVASGETLASLSIQSPLPFNVQKPLNNSDFRKLLG